MASENIKIRSLASKPEKFKPSIYQDHLSRLREEPFLFAEAAESLRIKQYLAEKIVVKYVPGLIMLETYGDPSSELYENFKPFHGKIEDYKQNIEELIESLQDYPTGNEEKQATRRVVVNSLILHWGQFEEDMQFATLKDLISTIQRIKVLEYLLGKESVAFLHQVQVLPQTLELEVELEAVLDKLYETIENVSEEVSQFTVETYAYVKVVIDDLESLTELIAQTGKLRKIKKNLRK